MSREKVINALFVALFFSATIFLFAPLQIYLTNRLEFPYPFSQIYYYLVVIFLIATLLITVLLLSLKFQIYKRIISLLFVLSFLLWFQGNILVWNYGVFDGREINWNKYVVGGLIDSSIWILLISIGLLKPAFIYKIFQKVSAVIILVSSISFVLNMAQALELPSYKKYQTSQEAEFNFSAKRNVIILVLDSFQTDFFQEIIDENNYYKKIFNGFTYFRNALANFPFTYLSVPSILTGRYYDNSIPVQEFIKREFLSNSLPKVLKNNGFQVDMYPFAYRYSVYLDPKIASNLEKGNYKINFEKVIVPIYKVALFRYTPHFIKRYFYNNEKLSLRNIFENKKINYSRRFAKVNAPSKEKYLCASSLNFIKEMNSRATIVSDKCIFKYYHINGMHSPLLFNEQLECEALPFDRQGYKKQAKGMLELVKIFLNKLKAIGAYDNSLIFIIGDHGVGLSVHIPGKMDIKNNGSKIRFEDTKGYERALPLILVKPFDSRGKMNSSDAPVCLSDIPKTVISGLGLKADFPGTPMFKIRESDIRERRYLFHKWESDYVKNDFLPAMDEYIVSGFSWFRKSWWATGRRLNPPKVSMYQPRSMWDRIIKLLNEQ